MEEGKLRLNGTRRIWSERSGVNLISDESES